MCKNAKRKKNFFLQKSVQKNFPRYRKKHAFFAKMVKKGSFLHDFRIKKFFEIFQNLGVKNFGF